MEYTLITKQGRVRQFYILAVAELYQRLDGGVLIAKNILEEDLTTGITEAIIKAH